MKPVTTWPNHPSVNIDSRVILEAKMTLVASHVSLLTAFEPGLPEDFVVTTIQGEKVVTEALGDLICPYRCSLYLHATFAPRVFTTEEVNRCVDIYRLVLRKATDYEHMNDARLDVYWNQPYPKGSYYGKVCRRRRVIADSMLYMRKVLLPCYDIDRQEEDGWEEGSENYPAFTLKELIEDDAKYQQFLAFWTNAQGFEDTCAAIRTACPSLPRDVINHILTILPEPDRLLSRLSDVE